MNKTTPSTKPLKQDGLDVENVADENEGEGNRTAARHYNDKTTAFVEAGKVDEAAEAARDALGTDEAAELEKAEKVGKSKARA